MVRKVTTKEKVLVHLLDYHSTRDKYQQPVEITQEGMAQAIGSKQNTISYSVRNLVNEGFLIEDTSRIKGKKQRRKGYFLTDKGVKKANKISSKINQSQVKAILKGQERELLIKDINKFFHTNFSTIEILKRLDNGVFEYESESTKMERADHTFNMPEPPATIPEGLSEFLEMLEAEDRLFLIEGDPGSGKTSLVTSAMEEYLGRIPIFYLKIEGWHNERYLWDHLAAFLSKNGEHKLSSYLESTRNVKVPEALQNLKGDLELISQAIFCIDDLDDNPILMRILCDFAKDIKEMQGVRMILTLKPGQCPIENKRRMRPEVVSLVCDECDNHMFVELADFYGMKESCEAVLDLVLENNLTPEEHLALSYISIHRYPIEKSEICKLESVNSNLITNLLKTPLATVSIDEKPIVHPQVRKRLLGRLPSTTEQILNSIAAEYYDEIPAKNIWEKLEVLYHLAGAFEFESFFEVIKENGLEMISSGYSRSLLDLIHRVENNMESAEDPSLLFWKGEAHRILNEYPLALSNYRSVIDNFEDQEMITSSHHGIARILEEQGQYESALLEYEKAIDISKGTSLIDSDITGKTLFQIAELYSKKGDIDDAKKYLIKAIDILNKNKAYPTLASAYFLMAHVEKESGNSEEALDAFEAGLSVWENIEETYHKVGGLHDIGAFYKVIRDLSHAEEFLIETIEMCEQMGYRKLKASALLTLTECYLERNELKKAVESAEEATMIFNKLDYEEERAYGHALLGQAYTRLDDMDKAEENLAKAISIYQKLGSSYPLGLAYFSMAKLQEKKGNKEGIASNFRKSLLSLSSSGASRVIEHVQREMKTIPLSM